MPFDFDAAVRAPFRMQPGLRRLAPGTPQLTPNAPGSPHLRAKLEVLSVDWPQALCAEDGFDATASLAALCAHAASARPPAWAWDGERATAKLLGIAVHRDGQVEASAGAGHGAGDAIARCLLGLPPAWRLAGLVALAFAEDLALVDGRSGTLRWLAVALPSRWTPEAQVGRHFTQIHAAVADNALLLKAADSLLALVTADDPGVCWERFVWTVTDHPGLDAHPARLGPAGQRRWQHTPVEAACWRTEHQTFIPLPGLDQAMFTIGIEVEPLADAIDTPARAAALHAAIASMSAAVLDYRGLTAVREPLLAWLAARR
jgi:hypothetical protein